MAPKIRVLYVEDDKEWQEIMREIVSALGYRIEIVSSSKDAMYKLKRSTYHIALLDKRLDEYNPENEDGLSIATVIAGLNEGTRIIVYTAYGNIQDAREAFRNIKVRDFIGKDRPLAEIKNALKESADEAVLEFRRPTRISPLLTMEDPAINKFLADFPPKSGLGSQEQDLELFAKRLLSEYRPLLHDRGEAKLLRTASNKNLLQVRFWSKMLGAPIAAWIGRYEEMKTVLHSLKSDGFPNTLPKVGSKIEELFDINSFPQFGGAVFELNDANFDEFVLRFEFNSYT